MAHNFLLSVLIAQRLRLSWLCFGRCKGFCMPLVRSKDFPAPGSAACDLHLPRCSFVFTSGLSPAPWGCCPGQMLHVALSWDAPCQDVVPMCRGKLRAAWGVWIRQLGCGTSLPPVSLLYRRCRAVRTEGGNQPWGVWWESAKETTDWAPKLPGYPAEPPAALLHVCCSAKGAQRERRNSHSHSQPVLLVLLMGPK